MSSPGPSRGGAAPPPREPLHPDAPGSSHLDIAWTVALLAAALTGFSAWRLALGLRGALGTDAPLWGLTAEGLVHGASPAVPPAWPALLALLRLAGAPLVPGGAALSLALAACVPPAVFLAARAAGASRRGALAAALVTLACPDLCAWSVQLQSNSLVALALVVATGLWGAVLSRAARSGPTTTGHGWLGVCAAISTGLLPLTRENAAVATVVALVAAPAVLRGGWRLSLVILATWWLSPLLVGATPGATPLDSPWSARSGMVLGDLGTGSGPLPNYVGEIPRADRPAYVRILREGDLPALAWWHAQRSLRVAGDGWAVAMAALGLIALQARRRPALAAWLLPLATIAPALLVWTQRRHVLLALPALLAACALAWPTRPPSTRRWLSAVVAASILVALATWPSRWRQRAEEQRGDTMRAASLAELADWICAQEPRFLGGPIQDIGLYCPRPRHDPDGSVADWHTLLVAPDRQAQAIVPTGWARVGPRAADLAVYALEPEQPRPCPDGEPAPGSPYLSTEPVHATLIGCAEATP